MGFISTRTIRPLKRWSYLAALLLVLAGFACADVEQTADPTPQLSDGGSDSAASFDDPAQSAAVTSTPESSPTTAPDLAPDDTTPDPTPTSTMVDLSTTEMVPAGHPLIPVPPDRDPYEIATRLRSSPDGAPPRTASPAPVPPDVGHRTTFRVSNLANDTVHTVDAVLQHVSDSAYWYVDERLALSTDDLRSAAESFESAVRPRITSTIGDIWSPGVDGDPRLTVLHTPLDRVAGYYGSRDEYTVQVQPNSNQREIIYLNGDQLTPGSFFYMGTLAHEFQHAVHWNLDHGEEIWVNEGMSEVARELAGYRASQVPSFLRRPSVQLNYWVSQSADTPAHYGAATLFIDYLRQHYGGSEGLGKLAKEQADGVLGVDAYLKTYDTNFRQVFKDWTVANLIDSSEGLYGYPDRQVSIRNPDLMFTTGERSETLAQFGTQYLDVRARQSNIAIEFEGQTDVSLFATDCFSGTRCWWSNQGDSIDSMLTREFDLTGVPFATLEYMVSHDIEEDWDYAYLEVSRDDGQTWDILHPEHATSSNPIGNAFGPGYTGASEGWVQETVNLSGYAGARILVRFEYITDDAIHGDGLVLDDLSLSEVGFFDDAEEDRGWDTAGFARTDNVLPQDYFVQVVLELSNGSFDVFDLPLDEDRRGDIAIEGLGDAYERAILVISPATVGTHQPATYTVRVSDAGP